MERTYCAFTFKRVEHYLAPRGTRRSSVSVAVFFCTFLLTRPSRDATSSGQLTGTITRFLLTRPSRDATSKSFDKLERDEISTHTSLAGRDAACLSL